MRIWRAGDQLSIILSARVHHAARRTLDRGGCHMRTFQDVEADATELVDIGVENLGEEADLGWRHGVVVREEQLQLECAT